MDNKKERCPVCSNYNIINTKTRTKIEVNGSLVEVQNIPAKYCSTCDEYFFNISILKKLAKEKSRNNVIMQY